MAAAEKLIQAKGKWDQEKSDWFLEVSADIMERVDLILYGDPADRGDKGDGDKLMLLISWLGKLLTGRCPNGNRRS